MMVDKCGPVSMRKNLLIVDSFKRAGLDFVPIPVMSPEHKQELISQMSAYLEVLVKSEDDG